VWLTVRSGGEVVFDERLWPMLSQQMGTHYGANVALDGPGTYTAEVQVGPPQNARHPEYADQWLEQFTWRSEFEWSG